MKTCLKLTLFLFLLTILKHSFALTYPLMPGQNLVGKIQTFTVGQNTNITDIAQQFDVGHYELIEANQGKDIDHLKPGDVLRIPTRYVLPDVPHHSLIINLAEMRLFYFPPGAHRVVTFPVGIGRAGWNTPVTITKVIAKKAHPNWYVPQSIQRDLALQGIQSPKVVKAGPGNPLGPYMLRLGLPTYLIHGSNDPSTVGNRSSSGCIHLYNNNIKTLFYLVQVGAQVNIINQPYQVAWQGNKLYLEAHSPIDKGVGIAIYDLRSFIHQILQESKKHPSAHINLGLAVKTAEAETGIPTVIGRLPNTATPAMAGIQEGGNQHSKGE